MDLPDPIRVAILGLDTSHSVEFSRRMQAPDCPEAQRVPGLRATACMRFPSPFQAESGQDQRQAQLQAWGVRIATDLDDLLREADAVMLEINDPTLHLPWFERIARCGKPVFSDKLLADTAVAGAHFLCLAVEHGTVATSASPLRCDAALAAACGAGLPAQGGASGDPLPPPRHFRQHLGTVARRVPLWRHGRAWVGEVHAESPGPPYRGTGAGSRRSRPGDWRADHREPDPEKTVGPG